MTNPEIWKERCRHMINVLRTFKSIALLSGALTLAGCGFHQAAAPRPANTLHHHGSVSSTAPSPSPSPSPSLQGSSPSASSTPSPSLSQSSPAPAEQSVAAPPPPGAGSYTSLKVSVLGATPEGESSASGHLLSVYRLTLQVENPTSGMIGLALNDFSVQSGPLAYAWNDYAAKGLTAGNSLFAFPLTPQSPASDVTQIIPGRPLTADITVQVPPAAAYQLDWNGTSNAVGPQARFNS